MTAALSLPKARPGEPSTAGSLHVLVVGLSWPPETFLAALLQGLLEAGFSITVATTRRPDEPWTRSARFHWLPAASVQGPAKLLRWARSSFGAVLRSPRGVVRSAAAARRSRSGLAPMDAFLRLLPFSGRSFDLIYFPWNSAAVDHLDLFDWGTPVLVSCRGSQIHVAPHDPRRLRLREALPETLRRAAAVHCVSESIRREAMLYGLSESRAHVIRPAVDVTRFSPRAAEARSDGPLRLITVGSLSWVKGHEYGIRAAAMLAQRGVPASLEIVGEGAERQRLLYTIDDLGLTGRVRLSGRLPSSEVAARLRDADVFVLPSASEGISNAALEAMACGLPVVTTDCGGMSEVVTDGVEGFVVPVRSPREMALRVEALYRDPRLRRAMGEAARARVVASFDSAAHVRHFAELCRSAAGRA